MFSSENVWFRLSKTTFFSGTVWFRLGKTMFSDKNYRLTLLIQYFLLQTIEWLQEFTTFCYKLLNYLRNSILLARTRWFYCMKSMFCAKKAWTVQTNRSRTKNSNDSTKQHKKTHYFQESQDGPTVTHPPPPSPAPLILQNIGIFVFFCTVVVF